MDARKTRLACSSQAQRSRGTPGEDSAGEPATLLHRHSRAPIPKHERRMPPPDNLLPAPGPPQHPIRPEPKIPQPPRRDVVHAPVHLEAPLPHRLPNGPVRHYDADALLDA